jgi:hypothetical protein
MTFTMKMNLKKNHPGVTLLIAILVLSTILAVSFSLASILLAESRNSGDLLRTEPALYADNAISEEAIFNISRNTGVTSYTPTVGALSVTSTSTPLNNPVQEVEIPSANTAFGCGVNCYVLYNPGNSYGPGGYGRIQVTFLNTNTIGEQLHIYLCQWDPGNPPRDLTTDDYANVCSQPHPSNLTYNYMTYQDSQPLSPGQTWDTNPGGSPPAPPGAFTCGGCMDPTGHDQQELILFQTNSLGQPSNIYAQISTWNSGGSPLGIPYFGKTAVKISSSNAGVNRDVQVVVPNSPANVSGGSAIGFLHSRELTVNPGQVTGTQSSFPVLVCFNATLGNGAACPSAPELKSASNGGVVQSNSGTDIVFASNSSGSNVLPYEQVNYVPGTGEAEYWVNLPSASSGTTFYVFYDKAGAVDQSNKNAVWNSNYKAVWHLSADGGLSLNDSTNNGNTLSNTNGVTVGGGQMAGAAVFNGSNNLFMPANQPQLQITNNETLSAWFKLSASGGGILFNQAQVAASVGSALAMVVNNLDFQIENNSSSVISPGSVADNNWHYAVATYASGVGTLYVDGAQVAQGTIGSTIAYGTTQPVYLGRNFGGGFITGLVDEARIESTVNSPGWIAAEFNNQSNPSLFFSLGAEN